ncbi:MAG: VPEID-CTERM sorting domain-containing protein [Candidatus Competibacteraceae bacterium]|nr:VPEID-CTERM sorting domain-containing protein [Candidatus Competibacteraceae bacterium]
MKKQLRSALVVSAVALQLVAGNCWADASEKGCLNSGGKARGCAPKVPEIDVGAGGGAIALLIGGLLLAAEKRRRSS